MEEGMLQCLRVAISDSDGWHDVIYRFEINLVDVRAVKEDGLYINLLLICLC